ncbi:kinase-like protein [Rhizopogon vinicolor AM-OR11-026]|uniref:Kinase-like protein n=1 Tax=Rhizopogon vinicolor AM-OR11-026 TaxID=1314800 RepID=A0A1B7MZD7_9AGAM|nr:kinase-like protein [Rhizopogon vinicolor AM-OR11-026]
MRELVGTRKVWSDTADKCIHSIIWKEGENHYQTNRSANEPFDLDTLPVTTPIPMHIFKGRWHPSLSELPPLIPTDSFLKRPCILLPEGYDADRPVRHDFLPPGYLMVEEAKIYEILRQHPHQNICAYYGCIREGDDLTAICLKKYGRILLHAVWEKDPTLNHAAILDDISKGLQFLHQTLGLVHNDIKPANIMLDDAGNAVIIDFDSCMPIGEEIPSYRKAGTPGWTMDPMQSVSDPENDLYGLTQIGEFLKGKRLGD